MPKKSTPQYDYSHPIYRDRKIRVLRQVRWGLPVLRREPR